jgi:hypothetical protein
MQSSIARLTEATEEQRLAKVAAIAYVVRSEPHCRVQYRHLGRALHDLRASTAATGAPASRALLNEVPLYFTVRDGWSSAELIRAVQEGCALRALEVGESGTVTLGPQAEEILATAMITEVHNCPRLVSVPTSADDEVGARDAPGTAAADQRHR